MSKPRINKGQLVSSSNTKTLNKLRNVNVIVYYNTNTFTIIKKLNKTIKNETEKIFNKSSDNISIFSGNTNTRN